MTSKPSEDEVSVNELVALDTEGIASVFATEIGVANTVVSSDTVIERKIDSLLYTKTHEEISYL